MRIKQLIMRYKLPAFLTAAIAMAALLVSISMIVYYNSGASQLDLSRPEYKSVRSQIVQDQKDKDMLFDSQGAITDEVLEDFLTRYKASSEELIELKAFSGEVLSSEQLGF